MIFINFFPKYFHILMWSKMRKGLFVSACKSRIERISGVYVRCFNFQCLVIKLKHLCEWAHKNWMWAHVVHAWSSLVDASKFQFERCNKIWVMIDICIVWLTPILRVLTFNRLVIKTKYLCKWDHKKSVRTCGAR